MLFGLLSMLCECVMHESYLDYVGFRTISKNGLEKKGGGGQGARNGRLQLACVLLG